MTSKRINYIDIARAFAIILIVFGHTIVHNGNTYWLYKLIYSFHIVLFFIISGYVYKEKKEIKTFIKQKFFSLMVPYFIFSILFLIPYFIFGNDVNSAINSEGKFNLLLLLKEIIYGTGANGALKQNTSLWFLPALFSTEVFYKVLMKKITKLNPYLKFLILLLISYLSTKITVIMPWGINTALTLTLFFYLGIVMKKNHTIEKISKNKWYFLVIIILSISCLFLYQYNITVSCVNYQYGNYVIFLFISIVISLFILLISYKIKNSKILEFIGKNTLSILLFHKIIILIFQTKIPFSKSILLTGTSYKCIIIAIMISILAIVISILIGTIIQKYFPYLYGKKEFKNEKASV